MATTCVAFSLLVILVTSVLMFSKSYHNATALIHTVVGFVFLVVAFWHLYNNLASIKKYLNPKCLLRKSEKYGFAPQLALVAMGALLTLGLMESSPLQRFHQWGMQLRVNDAGGSENESITYQLVGNYRDRGITLEVTKGGAMRWPQFAAWIETEAGAFIQPLYVSQSVASNQYDNTVTKIDSSARLTNNAFDLTESDFAQVFQFDSAINRGKTRFRRESLPVFLHKLKHDDDSDRPLTSNEITQLDGFTGATMVDNFMVSRPLPSESYGKVENLL